MKKVFMILFFIFILCITSISFADIYIKSREIDLGKLIQGRPINYTFYLKNTSDKPLHIKKIVPD